MKRKRQRERVKEITKTTKRKRKKKVTSSQLFETESERDPISSKQHFVPKVRKRREVKKRSNN